MGGVLSASIKQGIESASPDELRSAMQNMSTEAKEKLQNVIDPFSFASKLSDCCLSNPQNYKVVAEIPNVARLVEMTMQPGEEDKLHDHPAHSMYFVTPAKLAIKDYHYDTGKLDDEAHVVEIPAGAAPIFPPGAHQVKNVGDAEAKVVFVEAYPTCKPCGEVEGFTSPFKVAPECYKVIAEDENMYTGLLTMEVGQSDPVHHHKDHLIYVLEGDGVTINPGGDESQAIVKQIAPLHGLPAPMSAPPFAKHSLKNSGTKPLKMVFFEMKK